MECGLHTLIAGASGLIGSALCRALEEQGNICFKFIRSGSPTGLELLWDPGRVDQPLAEGAVLPDAEWVVNLSGANLASHRWTAKFKKTIVDSRVDSARAIETICSRMTRRPRVLVNASAIGIYGNRGNEVLTEASAPGTGFLPEVCEAWEEAAMASERLGIRVVCLRFGVVLSPQGGALTPLLPLFRFALGGQLGDGRQWTSWITLDDTVRAIIYALVHENMRGAYNTVSPQPSTNRDFTRALAAAVHRPAPWIVPGIALKVMMGQMASDTILASARVIPQRLQDEGFQFRSTDLEKALSTMLG